LLSIPKDRKLPAAVAEDPSEGYVNTNFLSKEIYV
jgi:hypothetical protein